MKIVLFVTLLILSLFAKEDTMDKEVATLGGGCFWCLEAVYEETKGVEEVVSGYAGGHIKNPTYEAVCTGTTGHAEVVEITFNPHVISYAQILKIFWTIHDPTTLNRQRNDVGSQYRSVIFYHSEAQKEVAEASLKEYSGVFSKPIVTTILPVPMFYPAEAYHQNYFRNNPNQGYCSVVVAPKVAKFKHTYKDFVK